VVDPNPDTGVEEDGAAAAGLVDKDKTTFSPSSRFSPSLTGGDPDFESDSSSSASAFARSICSAINIRSRASSDIVALSFFKLAS
jgi:hypothetical protein